jgi:hypothetical protein
MYRQIIGSLLIVCMLFACKKNDDLSYTELNEESHIQFSLDSTTTNEVSDPEDNRCSEYLFGGTAGYYFGCTTGFRVSSNSSVDITFGTAHVKEPAIKKDDLEKLIAVGSRDYGSLGAFSSYPALKPNCVEISFTDAQNRRWSSTSIKEQATNYGIDAIISILQPSSEFVIEHVKLQDASKLRYLVKGHFKCLLYEVNGQAKRSIKGYFRGIVDATD